MFFSFFQFIMSLKIVILEAYMQIIYKKYIQTKVEEEQG